jgi:hypothetical protein
VHSPKIELSGTSILVIINRYAQFCLLISLLCLYKKKKKERERESEREKKNGKSGCPQMWC